MNDKGLFKATMEGFAPFDRRGRDLHAKLLARTDHKPVFFTVRTARNPEFSSMAHVVFSKLADGCGVSIDAIKAFLKEETGRYDMVKMPTGKVLTLRRSVAFSAMTNEQFSAFWQDALPIIYEKLLGGVPSKEYDEIAAIIQGKRQGGI